MLIAIGSILTTSPLNYFLPTRDKIGLVRDVVLHAIFSTIDLFFSLRAREFTEEGVRNLEEAVLPRSLNALQALLSIRNQLLEIPGKFGGVKFHLLNHYPDFIRRYGSPANWDTDHFESGHKVFVKELYRRSAKRVEHIDLQMLRTVNNTFCSSHRHDSLT